ncbi:MAG: hypothetical protein LKJ76_07510 [Lachnospiraceae bacterium]|nr:hypothetical protein [Lachnospiraceae bacterium]
MMQKPVYKTSPSGIKYLTAGLLISALLFFSAAFPYFVAESLHGNAGTCSSAAMIFPAAAMLSAPVQAAGDLQAGSVPMFFYGTVQNDDDRFSFLPVTCSYVFLPAGGPVLSETPAFTKLSRASLCIIAYIHLSDGQKPLEDMQDML